MPPKLGEKYDNLYVVHQDGSYAKLTDIKDFDIGIPQNETYATGGFVPYDEYTPPHPFCACCLATLFTGTIHTTISRKKLHMALLGMTKRQYRLAIRLAERMRRRDLKRGVKNKLRFAMACNEVLKRDAQKKG